jgi:hypothetical protein
MTVTFGLAQEAGGWRSRSSATRGWRDWRDRLSHPWLAGLAQ